MVKTFICQSCKTTTQEENLKKQYETFGLSPEELGYGKGVPYLVCPICGCDELMEAIRCDACGEYFEDCDIDDGICYSCLAYAKKDFETELENIFAQHPSLYRKMVNIVYDGKLL